MVRAWFDVVEFLRENREEAVRIMANVVGNDPKEYDVFLSGTSFFDARANLQAFGPVSDPTSLLGVAPTIVKFLLDNKLIEGMPDPVKALDPSLVKEAGGAK